MSTTTNRSIVAHSLLLRCIYALIETKPQRYTALGVGASSDGDRNIWPRTEPRSSVPTAREIRRAGRTVVAGVAAPGELE